MAHHSALTKSHRVGLSHIWVRPESWPDEFFPVRVCDLVGSEYFDRLVLVGPAVHHPDSPPPFQNGMVGLSRAGAMGHKALTEKPPGWRRNSVTNQLR